MDQSEYHQIMQNSSEASGNSFYATKRSIKFVIAALAVLAVIEAVLVFKVWNRSESTPGGVKKFNHVLNIKNTSVSNVLSNAKFDSDNMTAIRDTCICCWEGCDCCWWCGC